MKYQRKMPEDTERNYKLVSPGEHKFQIIDIFKEDDMEITIKCEVISDVDNGMTILYKVALEESSQFFWLTKLFLKCIHEPNSGDVVIDTNAWIGRQFTGEVKHSPDNKYANIKKLIYKDEKQPVAEIVNPGNVKSAEEILWET